MGLMKTPVDLSKDIDEHCPAVLIISLREEMKGMGEQVSVRCQSKWRDVKKEFFFLFKFSTATSISQDIGWASREWEGPMTAQEILRHI